MRSILYKAALKAAIMFVVDTMEEGGAAIRISVDDTDDDDLRSYSVPYKVKRICQVPR
jgi:hypothetical protein